MIGSAAIVFLLITLLFPSVALAYIDPGTGSMLAQVVLGAVIGAVFWFRGQIATFVKKVKSLFW